MLSLYTTIGYKKHSKQERKILDAILLLHGSTEIHAIGHWGTGSLEIVSSCLVTTKAISARNFASSSSNTWKMKFYNYKIISYFSSCVKCKKIKYFFLFPTHIYR